MALQVCSRCRKKRIKCDLQLPACKNCKSADVECSFWDHSSGREIPCSYVHSLQQRKLRIQQEIDRTTAEDASTYPDDAVQTSFSHQSYHVNLKVNDGSQTSYLGTRTSASLVRNLLCSAINWHTARSIDLPPRLAVIDSLNLSEGPLVHHAAPFALNLDQRKVELYTIIPPSTQRALVEHYMRVVSDQYPILPKEVETELLALENPLKWASSNKASRIAQASTIVLAISAALITRDLDPTLSGISVRLEQDLERMSEGDGSLGGSVESPVWMVTALFALAIIEAVSPSSRRLWERLGIAVSALTNLRQNRNLGNTYDHAWLDRLDRSILKLESLTSLYFIRPSISCAMRLRLPDPMLGDGGVLSTELAIQAHLHNIAKHLAMFPRPPLSILESSLPDPLRAHPDAGMPVVSAVLYLALHPLFTDIDVCSAPILEGDSSRLLYLIATAASVIIEQYNQLNRENRVLSLAMATESVFQAGCVWSAYLMYWRNGLASIHSYTSDTSMRYVMEPIQQVSALLSSFLARWPGGSAYLRAWDALLELLWPMM